jgi:Uma2 family endonuclease
MSQPAFKAVDLPFELVVEDGIPMDHFLDSVQLSLFRSVIGQLMDERGRNDYCIGGNNFVYYSPEQAWDVYEGRPYYRGPDLFFVDHVPQRPRKAWVSWEEGGRLPDLIVELLSPSTETVDRGVKMDLHARVFGTSEYYLYDFDTAVLESYRLSGTAYRPVRPDRNGRFRSDVLGLDLGIWQGVVDNWDASWIRPFFPDGRLAPTRAEAERRRADEAEAELARLRALLNERSAP